MSTAIATKKNVAGKRAAPTRPHGLKLVRPPAKKAGSAAHRKVRHSKRARKHAEDTKPRPLAASSPVTVDTLVQRATADQVNREIPECLQWNADAPMRPPAWRWLRGDYLARHDKLPYRNLDDQHVDLSRRFLIQLGRVRQDSDYVRLRLAAPDLFDAWSVWQRGEQDITRANIEARILAREPFADIGRKLTLSESACKTYELIFFHVTDRLNFADYIINQVIGPKIHYGLTPADTCVLWKYFGYFGGIHVLEDLIYQEPGCGPCTRAQDVPGFYHNDAVAVLRRKMVVAMRTLPLDDPRIAIKFLRLGVRLQQIEARRRKSLPPLPPTAVFEESVDVMMSQLRAGRDGLDSGLPENFRKQYWQYMSQFSTTEKPLLSGC